jgi:SPX domain protein involved in polyphosphate accumulation
MNPTVDKEPTSFRWKPIDLDRLRHFMQTKIGWDKEKVDGFVLPVIKEMNRVQGLRQTTLDNFITETRTIKHKSARIQRLLGNKSD